MLSYYLNKGHSDTKGCRGGIGSMTSEDWGIEIAQQCNANPDMVSFLAHMPEITEFLKLHTDSSLARMIIKSMSIEEARISAKLRDDLNRELGRDALSKQPMPVQLKGRSQ